MKKVFIMAGLLLGGAKLVSAQNTQESRFFVKPPMDASKYVEIDDDDHDFGNILYSKPVKYVVHIQNIGSDTLTLPDISVSCGCTVPEWKHGASYAPRDTFSIRIGFDGYASGSFTRSLSLLFKDKNNNTIVKILRFHGVGYKKLPVAVDNSQDDNEDDIDATAFNNKGNIKSF